MSSANPRRCKVDRVDEDSTRRIGTNEALFRHVNERIEDVNRAFSELTSAMELVCECGAADCAQRITVPIDEYERVRADSALFLIATGHETPEVEHVVAEHGTWSVVRKDEGLPRRIAAETDPRA
jgi:hypothetical protein